MANFKTAYKITMRNEGGYVNDPQDNGGETWMGVARNFCPQWLGWPIVDHIKASKPINLNNALAADAQLTKLVFSFYKKNYWDVNRLDLINSQQVSNQLFDIGVNMGVARAARFLQQCVMPPITVDGQVGVKTVLAANAMDAPTLYNCINERRAAKYNQIIANNPSQAKFKRGWFTRIKPFDVRLT